MLRAVSHRSLRVLRSSGASSCRLMSAAPGNVDEELKPFYALGINIALRAAGQVKPLLAQHEKDAVIAGFSNTLHDKMSPKDVSGTLQTYGSKLNEIITGRSTSLLQFEKQKGADFAKEYLANNPNAVQTPSGLIYDERATGSGAQPSDSSSVTAHYHGTLNDGTVFDSSVERGEPITFPLGQVIQGWQEGLAMMKVGGRAVLVIPSSLAYGDEGSAPAIAPGATLQFDVELISVQ